MNRRKLKTGWEKSRDKGISPAALTLEAKRRRREWLLSHSQLLNHLLWNEREHK